MKVTYRLAHASQALSEVPALVRGAEAAGFDDVSTSELSCDPMLTLTVAAGVTSRIGLTTNIVVAFARSPMTLAVQACALQQYSGGRLTLGLGSQIKPHIERRYAMPWGKPAARMTEFVLALEAIWHSCASGDGLDFRGDFYELTLLTPMFTPTLTQQPPRVLLAAVGERMTEVAGAVAGGVLLHAFTTETYLREVTLPAIARGHAARSSGGDDFAVVSSALMVTGRTEEEFAASMTKVREQLAFYGSTPAYRPVLERSGWGELGDELHRLSRSPEESRWEQMGALIDEEVLDAFAIVGSPEEVGPKLVDRYGDVVTQYQMSLMAIDDISVADTVLQGIRKAAG